MLPRFGMKTLNSVVAFLGGLSILLLTAPAHGAAVVFSASGASASDIQATVDSFRASLGTLNPNTPGSVGSGRREINWDGVPDSFAAPNALPGDFFNANSSRGVVFSTPGTGFQVSANASSGEAVQFGNIDPIYPALFEPFSSQRLFTSIGSNVVDVRFFVPGDSAPALTQGFGSVFSDVDSANTTSIQYFDANNASLGTFFAASVLGDQTFSFLGVQFDTPIVSRVRIISGNQVLFPGNLESDLVVMDDFIYGEPGATASVPEGGQSLVLLGLGICGLVLWRNLSPSDVRSSIS